VGQLFFHADDSTPHIERLHSVAGKAGSWLLAGGAVLHGLSLLGQGSALFSIRVGVAGLFGWVLAIAYTVFGQRLGRNTLGAFVTPIVLLASLYSLTARDLHPQVRPEALETQWQFFHVALILLGYVSLAFAFAASLTYLLQEGLLKRKNLGGLWQRLPSLQVADELICPHHDFWTGNAHHRTVYRRGVAAALSSAVRAAARPESAFFHSHVGALCAVFGVALVAGLARTTY
jgi:ABC-type uncharacterized transport system permease subunit